MTDFTMKTDIVLTHFVNIYTGLTGLIVTIRIFSYNWVGYFEFSIVLINTIDNMTDCSRLHLIQVELYHLNQ